LRDRQPVNSGQLADYSNGIFGNKSGSDVIFNKFWPRCEVMEPSRWFASEVGKPASD
jgi:hypothetical protein